MERSAAFHAYLDATTKVANEKLYGSKKLLGAMYRSELAGELTRLGYNIEKTYADGRFEIAGVPRKVIEAFSTRRAEIEAAMAGLGGTADNHHNLLLVAMGVLKTG